MGVLSILSLQINLWPDWQSLKEPANSACKSSSTVMQSSLPRAAGIQTAASNHGNKGLVSWSLSPKDLSMFETPSQLLYLQRVVLNACVHTGTHPPLQRKSEHLAQNPLKAPLLPLPQRNFDQHCVTKEEAQSCPWEPLPSRTSERNECASYCQRQIKNVWYWYTLPRY